MVLKLLVEVVTEYFFPGQAGNMSMFVEPDFAIDNGSWCHYQHWYVSAFDSDNSFAYVLI